MPDFFETHWEAHAAKKASPTNNLKDVARATFRDGIEEAIRRITVAEVTAASDNQSKVFAKAAVLLRSLLPTPPL